MSVLEGKKKKKKFQFKAFSPSLVLWLKLTGARLVSGPITCQSGVKAEPCRREKKLGDWGFIQAIAGARGSLTLERPLVRI